MRQQGAKEAQESIKVSIHAPARGATSLSLCLIPFYLFQSTHPRGVRRRATLMRSKQESFNPRTREGCDKDRHRVLLFRDVSIHAPARGATDGLESANKHWQVSIHAPARGATPCFNQPTKNYYVSIHAPARGATLTEEEKAKAREVSIHAPARGATIVWLKSTAR